MASIVIAEDDGVLARIFAKWLETAGHEVTVTADGFDGLERSSGTRPDLVITDLIMPEMPGEDLALALEIAMPETPVLVVTGSTEEKNLREVLEAKNVREVLAKPVTMEQLVEAVGRALTPPEES
jgi:CheY-like chemotaxis protein